MSDRWPYSFDLDDLEITGCFLAPAPPMVDEDGEPINRSWSTSEEAMPQRGGDRLPGVWVTHTPTGEQVISTTQLTREANLHLALQRLDLQVRRRVR